MKLSSVETEFKYARSIDQLNQVLERYLSNINITTFAFTYYSYYPNSLNKLKYDFSSANFEPWHKHYISEGYEDVDSTLDVVYQTTLPTFWELTKQLKEAKSPREIKMREDSISFGVERGISIPIHGALEDFAIFLLVQMRGQNWYEQANELQYELFSVGYLYYFYLKKQLLKIQKPLEKYRLNKREIQCLTLLAQQYSVEAIAKSLTITERTVNYHIQRLNKKLGTKNKYQSVLKALHKGLIVL